MQEKYLSFLLKDCLKLEPSDTLFISYDSFINGDFKRDMDGLLQKMNVQNVYFFDRDSALKRKMLQEKENEEIEKFYTPLFQKWDEYALKKAKFLMTVSEIPGFMSNVKEEKLAFYHEIFQKNTTLFRDKEVRMEIDWCICALPNPYWAKDLFGKTPDSLEKLKDAIYKMCLIDKESPKKAWKDYLNTLKARTEKLNLLKIKTLHYENALGTDLYLTLPSSYVFKSAADEKILVNMPSYEVYTSPFFKGTNGIVFASKPLVYNGVMIEDFSLTFQDGKVISYEAKKGKDVLKSILETDEQSSYLGEVALVPYDSPISNTHLVFKTTLFDENASCHFALGAGFPDCIDSIEKTDEALLEKGINVSKTHVDFMIGTEDLKITAQTEEGEKLIFKDGNFVL